MKDAAGIDNTSNGQGRLSNRHSRPKKTWSEDEKQILRHLYSHHVETEVEIMRGDVDCRIQQWAQQKIAIRKQRWIA